MFIASKKEFLMDTLLNGLKMVGRHADLIPTDLNKMPNRSAKKWWACLDSNQGPQSYQDCALTA